MTYNHNQYKIKLIEWYLSHHYYSIITSHIAYSAFDCSYPQQLYNFRGIHAISLSLFCLVCLHFSSSYSFYFYRYACATNRLGFFVALLVQCNTIFSVLPPLFCKTIFSIVLLLRLYITVECVAQFTVTQHMRSNRKQEEHTKDF